MSEHVLKTPVWVFAVRLAQVLVSLIVLGLSADIAHDLYLDELGLAIAVSVLTWIVVTYALTTEKVTAWNVGYHILAVVVLDGFMLIMWLAAWAAVAARRATFRIPAVVSECYDNGDIVNSKSCLRKRALFKRDYLFKKGQAEMSAAAGLGALVWLLFIATFAWTLVQFLRGRKDGRFPIGAPASGSSAEPKVEQQPMVAQQPIQTQTTGPPQQQQQQPYEQYPPAQSPYQQQPPYAPPLTQSPPPEQQYPQQYPQPYPQQQQPQPYPQQEPQPYQQPELHGQNYVPPAASPPPQQYHQQ